jgi:hypothetical protein
LRVTSRGLGDVYKRQVVYYRRHNMKIIAEIPHRYGNQYVVQVSEEDLNRLTGLRNQHYSVGTEIKVSESFKIVQAHRDAKEQLENVAHTLTALASMCRQQGPLMDVREEKGP